MLMVLALSQITVENDAVPDIMRPPQPAFMGAAISYLRLNQGWGMFAPNAPREDMMVVVDALTVDGRHIDPYNMRASLIPVCASCPTGSGKTISTATTPRASKKQACSTSRCANGPWRTIDARNARKTRS
jgi:hypothetical protein